MKKNKIERKDLLVRGAIKEMPHPQKLGQFYKLSKDILKKFEINFPK